VEQNEDLQLTAEHGEKLFGWMMRTYIEPEVERRFKAGDMPDGTVLYQAQVVFTIDEAPQIRLNEEVRGGGIAKAARALEAGQDVTTDDIAAWERFQLPEDEADAAHVTLLRVRDGWSITFDGTYNTALVSAHLETASEFVELAEHAVAHGRLRAFPEIAFAAAELLAKAELLTVPDKELRDARRHDAVRQPYNLWAKSGNTEMRFAALLNMVGKLRESARYLRTELQLTQRQAEEMLQTLIAMRAQVQNTAPSRNLNEPPKPRVVFAVAAEPIEAGVPVALLKAKERSRSSTGSGSNRPPRSASPRFDRGPVDGGIADPS
jgi:hypothetical protein